MGKEEEEEEAPVVAAGCTSTSLASAASTHAARPTLGKAASSFICPENEAEEELQHHEPSMFTKISTVRRIVSWGGGGRR